MVVSRVVPPFVAVSFVVLLSMVVGEICDVLAKRQNAIAGTMFTESKID